MPDRNGRLHTSMNINTETGRLSSRRPNLQNQPALEKDRYKIRECFSAQKGKKLIVADYGQLELRLLAHMSRCKSMLDAFATGGDFHSRTALGMYDEIKEAIAKGDCLLEWDSGANGAPPAPLLKDKFGQERRRAKTLNFSIAYGKTARGLAMDWETSVSEAKDTLERWYADRPEVREWQEHTVRRAKIDRLYQDTNGSIAGVAGRATRSTRCAHGARRHQHAVARWCGRHCDGRYVKARARSSATQARLCAAAASARRSDSRRTGRERRRSASSSD
eukprot:TRINITY_DN367_c0_g1_i1.p1 TRINITY_DN367_c0_g1~~TRINITY_DN367_c0_g1_i1.p1  ORF type:complete len:277 (-),score=49.14 TRINITY_DN367_c0_g1_i1:130-960(-)